MATTSVMPHRTKTSEHIEGPIIFTLPGFTIDTRLKVFKQEFHVHSLMLKLHSRYFRTFLDSADKTPADATAQWKYDYDTVVDADGKTWGLEVTSKILEPQRKFKRSKNNESAAFKSLLFCIYNRPFSINGVNDLDTLATLADFYGCLAPVSNGLNGSFVQSQQFLQELPDSSARTLKISVKLRNKILFVECMIHVVGGWGNCSGILGQQNSGLEDFPDLQRIASKLYGQILLNCMKFHLEISKLSGLPVLNPDLPYQHIIIADRVEHHLNQWRQRQSGSWRKNCGDYSSFLSYYRSLAEDDFESSTTHLLTEDGQPMPLMDVDSARWRAFGLATPLLKVNLVLIPADSSFHPVPGEDRYGDKFLCADVKDEDIPWDVNETDW